MSTGKLPSPDDDWRYELKYDGWRAQIHVTAEGVRIFTRSGIDWTDRFPHLAGEIAASIEQPCILDGEVCALDASGRPDFTTLCGQVPAKGTLDFFAFDLIGTGSDLLTDLPLNERRTQLQAIVPRGPSAFHLVEQFDQPDDLLRFVHSNGWEGIVAKRLSSPYHSAQRTSDWLKLKCKQRQEFVIAGWRPDPQTGAIKSLVLATVDNGELTLRGSVGTGLPALEVGDVGAFTPLEPADFNQQSREVFAAEAATVAAAAPKIVWRAPSREDLADPPAVVEELASVGPVDAIDLAVAAQGGRSRGTVLHKLVEEVLTGETADERFALISRAGELIGMFGETASLSGTLDAEELAECVVRSLAIPEIRDLRGRLAPEFPVYGSTVQVGVDVVTAGIADAIAFDDQGRPEIVVDWKSDISPSQQTLAHFRQQVGAYLALTGAKLGLIVLMSSAAVLKIVPEMHA